MLQLRDYQREDVERIKNEKRFGLFNEQRTGKTPTICVLLKEINAKRPVIICPSSMTYVWKGEYERWTGNKATVLKDFQSFNKLDGTEAIILNYEKIRFKNRDVYTYLKALKKLKPDVLILDEAHNLCNRNADQTIACANLAKDVEYCVLATGTPARDKPWDVWSILNIMLPKTFTSYWRFVDEYFYMQTNYYHKGGVPIGYRAGKELELANLMKLYSIQRKRTELRDWERNIDPISVILPATAQQLEIIEALETYFEYKDLIITKTILDTLIRVRQVCSHPGIFTGERGISPKANWVIDYIKDYPEKQIICFSLSRKFIEILLEELSSPSKIKKFRCELITGETAPKKRALLVEEFQKGLINVLLIQTQTGKEGLTLDSADTTIFLDTYPPASMYSQAKDRMVATTVEHDKPKELYHLMIEDTYDAVLYSLVEHNIDESEVINNYDEYIKNRRK